MFRLRRKARQFFFCLRRNIAFGEKGPTHFFSPAAKNGAAQEKLGAEIRTMPSVRGEERGVYDKKAHQRNITTCLTPWFGHQQEPPPQSCSQWTDGRCCCNRHLFLFTQVIMFPPSTAWSPKMVVTSISTSNVCPCCSSRKKKKNKQENRA